MNLSPSCVERLSRHGLEAIHWSTIGSPTAPDEEILAWAKARDFVLLTHDLDFAAILAATGERAPSVVLVRTHDILSDEAVEAVVAAVKDQAESLRSGALLSIDEGGSRVRVLPIRP